MNILILKGTILSAPELGRLDVIENGFLIARNGKIVGCFDSLPEEYAAYPVEDYGNALILQSFSDMHLHGPQFPMLGMGMDKELLSWLDTYTWPTEAQFADADYARRVYRALAKALVKNGTTRVCMFSSLHKEGTLVLMEELEKAGISGFVGKVNMDRNSGKGLSETTEESMEATLAWLAECDRFQNVKPILTPRFSPSCTEELMAFLGKLAKERGLPIQSHLSESMGEIAWVKELFPDCERYYQTYEKFGLWNDKTLMAHCVWCDDRELAAIRDSGVTVVHCADSNTNLRSGIAPVRKMLDMGISVVLGSDISGGEQLCGFDVVRSSLKASKLRQVLDPQQPPHLTAAEGWYLATSKANLYFGEKPGFAPGNRVNVMVVDDSRLPAPRPLSAQERFERLLHCRQDLAIVALYSGEKRLSTDG